MARVHQASDATEASAFQIHLEDLVLLLCGIVIRVWRQGGVALAAFALHALTPAGIQSGCHEHLRETTRTRVHARYSNLSPVKIDLALRHGPLSGASSGQRISRTRCPITGRNRLWWLRMPELSSSSDS